MLIIAASTTAHAGAMSHALTSSQAEAVALVVENEHASQVAEEEATGVLCAEVQVLAGPVHPPAPACPCTDPDRSIGRQTRAA